MSPVRAMIAAMSRQAWWPQAGSFRHQAHGCHSRPAWSLIGRKGVGAPSGMVPMLAGGGWVGQRRVEQLQGLVVTTGGAADMAEDPQINHMRRVLAKPGELIYLGELTPKQRAAEHDDAEAAAGAGNAAGGGQGQGVGVLALPLAFTVVLRRYSLSADRFG